MTEQVDRIRGMTRLGQHGRDVRQERRTSRIRAAADRACRHGHTAPHAPRLDRPEPAERQLASRGKFTEWRIIVQEMPETPHREAALIGRGRRIFTDPDRDRRDRRRRDAVRRSSTQTPRPPLSNRAQYKALQARITRTPVRHSRTSLGNTNAPVVIEEFADFECPSCGRFATITEPDIRKNIVEVGTRVLQVLRFPTPHAPQHAGGVQRRGVRQGAGQVLADARPALRAARIAWGLTSTESEATDDPKSVFLGYAKTIGLDTHAVGAVLRRAEISSAHRRQRRRSAQPQGRNRRRRFT